MLQSYIKQILFAIQEPLSGQKQMLNLTISDSGQKMIDVAVFELTHWSFCLPGEFDVGWSCPTVPPAGEYRCLHIDSASADF